MAVVKLACADVTANSLYGLSVALYVGLSDILLICLSYALILRTVLRLPGEAQRKAFNTCGSHICVILVTFVPGLFSILTHRFGHRVAPHVRVLLANLYLLLPPTLNPIVYGVKTREIRERVLHAFLGRKNGAGEIQFNTCLTQMFFIHALCMMESAVLLAMAVDRYVAICFPLRYNSFFSGSLVAQMEIAAVVRGTLLMCPCPFLIKRLSFCQTNVIHHTYCEHMAVVKLACGDTRINSVYGLSVALIVIGGDLLCIGLSYFFIVRAVLRLSSSEARLKAFGTCGSHLCVITISYSPALFSFFTHRFGHNVAPHVHILLANFYLLVPPLLNPIVYGVRTKEIWKQVIRVFLPNQVMVKPRTVCICSPKAPSPSCPLRCS
ncbi:hypothetical protein L345_12594, partial [Ophiophagus hannah]